MKTTVLIKNVKIDVEFGYQPFEPAETGQEAQYPGCKAEVWIDKFSIFGVDVESLIDYVDQTRAEIEILELIQDGELDYE